jgi:ABC-type lipoprotein release transport system permease subunit
MLTLINLVVVSGILVGIIEGSVKAHGDQFTGDIFLSTKAGKDTIEQSRNILATIESIPGIYHYTARYTQGAQLEANYRERRDPKELRDTVNTTLVGLNPEMEDEVTGLSRMVIEGEYLTSDDTGYVLLGSMNLEQYSPLGKGDEFGFPTLSNISIGSRIQVKVGGATKEYIVKGIVDTKVDQVSMRVFLPEHEFVRLTKRSDLNVNEIAIRVKKKVELIKIKQALLDSGVDRNAVVRTLREGLPSFLLDMIDTMTMLGNVISSMSLAVSSVTIFIVVFVNAITRRKYIGILKGIGIRAEAIELSYVFQSLFYVIMGSTVALVLIYTMLIPFFNSHPIDFPFSDGILVAPLASTIFKLTILIFSTIIAGYIPARMIIKRNTLDSILGR